uniref:Uncharacterized protein n=1 Tax=Anguilla anguilla TaxID=7936 RepID=A0A0E9XND8_ANGAN
MEMNSQSQSVELQHQIMQQLVEKQLSLQLNIMVLQRGPLTETAAHCMMLKPVLTLQLNKTPGGDWISLENTESPQ